MFRYFIFYLFVGGVIFFGKQLFFVKSIEKEKIIISKERIIELKKKSMDLGKELDHKILKAQIEEEIVNEILFKEALKLKMNESDSLVKKWLIRNMKFLLKGDHIEGGKKIRDEGYLKQALSLGLDKKDLVVRRILINKMKNVLYYKKGIINPTLKEIKKYQMDHLSKFSSPPLFKFDHFFYKKLRDAKNNMAFLNNKGGMYSKSDYFHLGKNISLSKNEIEENFGKKFYNNMILKIKSKKWAGPIQSEFGFHLIKVEKNRSRRPHPLNLVKDKIKWLIIEERKKIVLKKEIDKLYNKYEILLPSEEG